MSKQLPLKESPQPPQVSVAKKAAALKGTTKPARSPQLIAANQDHAAEAALAADHGRSQHDRKHVYGPRGPPAAHKRALPLDDLVLRAERKRLVPLSDATIWRMERRGQFPRRIAISDRRVAWRRSEIEQWLQQRAAASQAS